MYSTIDPSYLVSSMKVKSFHYHDRLWLKMCHISLSPSSANNLFTSLSGDRRLLGKANALPLYTEGNPAAFVPSSTSFATKNCCTQFRYVELSLSALKLRNACAYHCHSRVSPTFITNLSCSKHTNGSAVSSNSDTISITQHEQNTHDYSCACSELHALHHLKDMYNTCTK